jgi:prepilin peptidase CpaA
MNVPLQFAIPTIVIAACAAWFDVGRRRVPNALTLPALAAGVAVHAAVAGWSGAGSSLVGALVALVLVPGWLAGWMGAGDVKLLMALGAWLAFPSAAAAVLFSLIAGGVIAIAYAARRGILQQTFSGAAWLALWAVVPRNGAPLAQPATSGVRFPFAVAVLIGSGAALWVRL